MKWKRELASTLFWMIPNKVEETIWPMLKEATIHPKYVSVASLSIYKEKEEWVIEKERENKGR